MSAIPDGSIDAVVTSPPYLQQRNYGGGLKPWDELMDVFLHSSWASDECQLLINLGLVHRDGECVPYWEAWRERMRASGWRFFGWYVWDQTFGLPGDWNGRFAPSHEFVFHFNKKPVTPHKVSPTKVKRIVNGTGLRKRDGTTTPQMSHHGRPTQPFKVSDSVIRICREASRVIKHPAKFPVKFARHLVDSFTSEGQTVLDPFMGSGSTGAACVNTGRNFIGIEIDKGYFDIASKRISAAQQERESMLIAS